jgi:P27 family predicted phage terminase small subunit
VVAKRDSVLRVVDEAAQAATDAAVGGLGVNWAEVPSDVAGCADSATEWRRLAVVFADQPTRFREGDRSALAAYCVSHAVVRLAGAELLRDGLIVAGRGHGDENRRVKSPALAAWTAASGQLRFWCRELGLSPDARARQGIHEPAEAVDDGNPFA